jgi:hypothetical protein
MQKHKGLTYTIASYLKFPCVKDLVFLRTINSWQLGLSARSLYNTEGYTFSLHTL